MHDLITHGRLLERLHYFPATGDFMRNGRVAGNTSPTGYRRICVGGRLYPAHRLAWFYVHGEWPADCIDHINGIRHDNRISNLREASHQVNAENIRTARKTSRIGILGVSKLPAGRYRALIQFQKKNYHLGVFDTPEQAHSAYLTAKRRLHEGCTI